jgi:hypothetical protein
MSTMNTEALFLFLILLFGLVLCSFLGGNCKKEGMDNQNTNLNQSRGNGNNLNFNQNSSNGASTSSGNVYDNYNHYSGASTQLANGTTFYGPNGGTVVVSTGSDGNQTLEATLANGQSPMAFNTSTSSTTGNNGSATTFDGPNNSTATVVNGDGGQQAIQVQTSSGSYTFTQSGSDSNQSNTTSSTQYYGSTGSPVQNSSNLSYQQGPYGGSAGSVTGPNGNTAYYAQGPAGNTVAGTNDSNYPYNNASSNQYYGPNGGNAGSVTGPAGNTAYYAQGPAGNTAAGTSSGYGNQYYSSLPPGIPASQIIPGQEDLYILKSEVVPPVCPVCPTSSACPRQEPCPSCPPCGRCPEPSFECKKVPNYNAINNEYLPAPVLSDFSSFGM